MTFLFYNLMPYHIVKKELLLWLLQRDAREIALRESWARERDAALDREQAAASERLRDNANRHVPLPSEAHHSMTPDPRMMRHTCHELEPLNGINQDPTCNVTI